MDRYIYILVDPRDSRIYYVGFTGDPSSRMKEHYSHHFSPHSEKDRWIERIRDDGIELQLVVIETVDANKVREREISWIRKLGFLRAPLMNDLYFKSHRHIKDLMIR